jgi:hypothetical protein
MLKTLYYTLTTPQRPLAALMDLYEENYRLFSKLLNDLPPPKHLPKQLKEALKKQATFEGLYSANQHPDLHWLLLEQSPYTQEYRLTYLFEEGLVPNLRIKIYHDARMAEAVSWGSRPPWPTEIGGDPLADRYLKDQWSRNMLLFKWLQYLLECGYGPKNS